MSSYESFASVYDMFMDNVDYDAWSRYIIRRLAGYGIENGLVCELGCGTGSMTERLADAGYDMIGIDNSVDMLEIAQEKKYESGHEGILYLNQDMREFELYGTVRAIISVCDSMNYMTEDQDLLQVFRLVNNYLDPDGIFIFDMNTVAKYEGIGDATIAENREDGSFIWENTYDAEQQLNEYAVTLFLPEEDEGTEDILYRKYEEIHLQKAYTLSRIQELLAEAGLIFLDARDAYTDQPVSDRTERMTVIAKEHGKSWED